MDSEKVVNMVPKMKMSKSFITFGLVIVLLVILALDAFVIVNAGQRGIVLQLGAVRPIVLTEGLHFKIPFVQSVVPMEVRVQKSQSEQTAASKDLQIVTTTVAVNFHLDPIQVNKLYQNVGLSYGERIVDPAIGEAVKAITAQYTAEELISKRSEVSAKIKETLASKLATYYMVLDEINITEFKFSQEFNNAIEQKQIAEQQALKANLDLQRIEIEAKQKVEQAKAEAESLRLQKQEVTPELVQLREIEAKIKAIEKWDGKLPNVTGGAVPFIDVNSGQ
ncbi:SPFH domain-containing protein [Desulfitobacterium sp. LBE]|uniref:Band 7 domain-containing protein n=5 Tax=root TaxID=1 RepID=Q24NU9_DESHY|nr:MULTISPECIES: prohibitin family protein [Desulfitobacterium]ACL18878.1 band 7 protein [Desulfitobacterium hafniense DCB-2]KTE89196.1 HflC protein [Desulfitobacterium hafniense]MEA5021843.1 prohibitin family protein [Desulfitobacterium hafniense]TWH58270.1 SPFH domain-containing protein [Desulfitobacterium sp. LBE]CDX04767.1 SPFH domain, Band 7 protein [Desulfitobacterium hafniense]